MSTPETRAGEVGKLLNASGGGAALPGWATYGTVFGAAIAAAVVLDGALGTSRSVCSSSRP